MFPFDVAYLVTPGSSRLVEKGRFSPDREAAWQHTFFQGGFALIINNGIDAPQYILDTDGNVVIDNVPNFATLPGWESYNVEDIAISDTFNEDIETRTFDYGRPASVFQSFNLEVTLTYPSEATGYPTTCLLYTSPSPRD